MASRSAVPFPTHLSKPVDQKANGAYYTDADVTGYLARSALIPFLLDAVQAKYPDALRPAGPVWRLLQVDPDRYLHDAMRHGDRLPTETEREYRDRRNRCIDSRHHL